MEIHQRIYDAIATDWDKQFEDIGRGIDRGAITSAEAAIALGHLSDLENMRRRVAGIRLEYDIDLEINLEYDLLVLEVALAELATFLHHPSSLERDKIRAKVFGKAAFERVKELRSGSNEYKEA